MSKVNDTFAASVQALREWLDFLDIKEGELNAKLERMRQGANQAARSAPAPVPAPAPAPAPVVAVEEDAGAWLDESPVDISPAPVDDIPWL